MFKPNYKVHINRATGTRCVAVNGDFVTVFKVQQGSRKFYAHYLNNKQSQLYPTLRDCVFNIVYGV